jgi:hypothetical protein
MPTLVSHISEIAFAELVPDGNLPVALAELDLDLDAQDIQLHVPESELEIALPGSW